MSSKHPHPGRTVGIFLLVIAALFGAMALSKAWTPKMGLDLRGGTNITLTATKSGPIESSSLELARTIIQRRVDSLGVSETAVSIQGDRQIQISVPNVQQDELVRLVGTTAQLTFRQVLMGTPTKSADSADQPKVGLPTMPAKPTPTPEAPTTPGASPSAAVSASPQGSATPAPASTAPVTIDVQKRLAYEPTPQDMQALQDFSCDKKPTEVPDKALITCDKEKQMKYLLGPVLIEGKELTDAQAGVPQQKLNWQVNLSFNDKGAKSFGDVTTQLVAMPEPKNQFAIVIDAMVQSAPRVQSAITAGQAEITGQFNQKTASELANVLKFGALPLAFEVSSVDNISATLGADQLRGGIIAGLIGLALVVAYAFLYYRGLGIVVVASLAIAGLFTYAMLVLLGQWLDLALNLPGIAGAIVAIGVTADSFIIYFERIRDEVREGRSLRSGIETGWKKARGTIIVADAVSLLSALVLFILAMGPVRGFAFTLGLTTLIDLAIVFWFTHPFMSLLGRTKFFGEGHRLSGLDAGHMGVERVVATNAPAPVNRRKAPPPKKAKQSEAISTASADETTKEA